MSDVLIVEDKQSFGETLKLSLDDARITALHVKTGREALQVFKKERFDVCLLDLRLPDIDGIDLLREMKKIDTENDTKYVMMTAFGSIERAVEAMKLGACDFLTKPFDVEQLITLLNKLLEEQRCRHENILLKDAMSRVLGMPEIVGRSAAIRKSLELLKKVAGTDTTVLILGDSGTGKELFARACHELSPRKQEPFVAINCAAIPRELIENELFGSEKGAFTGAVARKMGKFELAHRGTIFLDEIGDLDLDLQAKILRVLQEKTFERLGGTVSIKSDVRIIAASNQNLTGLVKEKRFREDLYYRLSVFPITLPPLRERIDDIPALVDAVLKKIDVRPSGKKLTTKALEKLARYDWPGNIRELENTIERANILAGTSPAIGPEHILLPESKTGLSGSDVTDYLKQDKGLKNAGAFGREMAEAQLIKKTLEQTSGNKSEAARRLGVSYKTLLGRITRFKQKNLL
ncbi:MAG TPA: sigma-54 dependent transcriptional regulator [bacterium]